MDGQDEIDEKMEEYIRIVSRNLSYGDWYLCYNLVTYVEWLEKMTELLMDKEEKKAEENKKRRKSK